MVSKGIDKVRSCTRYMLHEQSSHVHVTFLSRGHWFGVLSLVN